MDDDQIEQLLKRANRLEDMAAASKDESFRKQLRSLAESYRKMAGEEQRLRESRLPKT